MDIYFCDECAARVTDADLHRGHGIKKGDVIVCGSCIEKGVGLDRLSEVGAEVPQATAQPALAGAGALDEIRDRASTSLADPRMEEPDDLPEIIESDEPEIEIPEPVTEDVPAVEAVADEPFTDVEDPFAEEGDEPLPKATEETHAIRRTKSDDIVDVASGFSALSSDDRTKSDIEDLPEDIQPLDESEEDPYGDVDDFIDEDDEDDLIDDADDDDLIDDLVDEADSNESDDAIDLSSDDDLVADGYEDEDESLAQADIATSDMKSVAEDDDIDEDDDLDDDEDEDEEESSEDTAGGSSRKRRRRGGRRGGGGKSSSRHVRPEKENKSGRAGVAKSGASSKRAATSNSSSKTGKASSRNQTQSGKSSRRGPAPKKKNTMGIMIGVISALCFGIVGLLIITSMSGGDDQASSGRSNPVDAMSDQIGKAYKLANSARSDDLSALRAAKQEIFKADQEVYRLMDNLPDGWSEQDLNHQLQLVKYQDMKGQLRAVNDRISVLEAQGR